ncbi:MAG: glycoside hydrolase family 36 protein [Terricaulis sp.]
MTERPRLSTHRRAVLGLFGVAAASVYAPAALAAPGTRLRRAQVADSVIAIDFDTQMRTRISRAGQPITRFDASDVLLTANGEALDSFALADLREDPVQDAHGAGRRTVLRGRAENGVEKEISLTLYERYPGLALQETRFTNHGPAALDVSGWRGGAHVLGARSGGAYSFSGASHDDRRDWLQRVEAGFDQRNFMGMNASDYGGGTPVAVVWRRDGGLAIGHVETVPKLISLPVSAERGGTAIAMEGEETRTLAPGETLIAPRLMIMTHEGDYFRPLDAYRRIMADQGLAAPAIPDTSYEPIWCAWGYERNFTTEEIYGTLAKVKSLGLYAAVLDDGWQTSEGDWKIDTRKFPRGGADMRAFTDRIKADGLHPRLWVAPLAADPGTDLLHDHPDMLLLNADGAPQLVTWWNSFTLCPAYQPVIDYHKALVRRIIGEWGFEGLKLDGQHLNAVAPCHNPAHNHARPEESYERLQDFWKAIYDEAIAINPITVVEICPCGTSFAFHNIPAMNQTPSSDPLSSWQIRHKGKTIKALAGPSAPFSGDHVELSDRREDFASAYGIGAVLSTKFTWPEDTPRPIDTLPPGGFVLTAEKEELWRKWIALYRENMLPKGAYRGELYDIGFDKPEAHAVSAGERMHYAFYADAYSGPVTLRGLGAGQYALRNSFTGEALGVADAQNNIVEASFEHFLLIEATPVESAS